MFKFHYHYIKNKYGNKSKLLFTDTDSLMYETKTENVYEGFSKDKEMFDSSNYSANYSKNTNNNTITNQIQPHDHSARIAFTNKFFIKS